MASINFKRSMKLLLKDMAGLNGTPKPKRGLTAWVKNEESSYKRDIKRLFLARHETSTGYMADNQSQGS